LKQFCELEEPTKELLKNAMADYNLSARAYDLASSERITSEHISEAIQLRSLDRQLW
jgi:magnesium chelatase family protein